MADQVGQVPPQEKDARRQQLRREEVRLGQHDLICDRSRRKKTSGRVGEIRGGTCRLVLLRGKTPRLLPGEAQHATSVRRGYEEQEQEEEREC